MDDIRTGSIGEYLIDSDQVDSYKTVKKNKIYQIKKKTITTNVVRLKQ